MTGADRMADHAKGRTYRSKLIPVSPRVQAAWDELRTALNDAARPLTGRDTFEIPPLYAHDLPGAERPARDRGGQRQRVFHDGPRPAAHRAGMVRLTHLAARASTTAPNLRIVWLTRGKGPRMTPRAAKLLRYFRTAVPA